MSSIWTVRRSRTDAKLAGVCGGVAEHWNVDPVLVRLGCALLALSGGVGIVLYVAGWLLIPLEGEEDAKIHELLGDQARRWSREVWIVIVVIACVISSATLSSVSPFGFGPAVVLAVIWYFGYYRNKARRNPPAPPPSVTPAPPAQSQFDAYSGPPTAFTQAADAWRQRLVETQRAATAPTNPTVTPPAHAPEFRSEPAGFVGPADPDLSEHNAFLAHPDPVGIYTAETPPVSARVSAADTRPARRLRLVALLVVGLLLAGLGVAAGQGVAIPLAAYFAAALLVVGVTLIAATWFGRARGLLPVGMLLAVVTVVLSAIGPVARVDHWSDTYVSHDTVADFPAAGDTRDMGNFTVDLSRVTLSGNATYRAHVDLGRLKVAVPKDTNVVINYAVDAGAVTAFGQQVANGTDRQGVVPASPSLSGKPTLTLDLSVDVGQVEVER